MATTMRQLMNRILRVLDPQDEISDATAELSEDYHKLIAAFVNTFKEEVEDAHQWRALRQKHTVTVNASANTGTVTNATDRSRTIRLIQSERMGSTALCYDVTDSSNPDQMHEMDLAELLHLTEMDPDLTTNDSPSHFALDNSSSGVLTMYVYPTPTSQRTISIYCTTPQARLDDDDLDVNILVPTRPIEMGALWYAMEERGEELGAKALFNEERYRAALGDAIARDDTEQGNAAELYLS